MLSTLFFATSNKSKLQEAREILGVDVEGVELDIFEVQDPDPLVVVEEKARVAFEQVQEPVIVDDTALFINAWNGLPGVYIDAFTKSVGNEGILRMLEKFSDRSAVAQTTIGLALSEENVFSFAGKVRGDITKSEKGSEGFGWDPIFKPQGSEKTYAQMTAEEKNKISMRRRALMELRRYLGERGQGEVRTEVLSYTCGLSNLLVLFLGFRL